VVTDILHVDEETFLQHVENPTCARAFSVYVSGGETPLLVKRRKSPVLVITFAGAIDRSKLHPPKYGGKGLSAYLSTSVVGIADPSLSIFPSLITAWYAGHEGFETQQLLPGLIRRLAAACEAERVIFVGGSAGGFAALYFSWLLPGSIVIATNPQTDLDRQAVVPPDNYRTSCRPSLGEDERLSSVIASSVVSCYAERFDNTVIYLQNASDSIHVHDHFAPFLAAIDVAHQKRLLARLGYWGLDGHRQLPVHEWLAWLKAAIDSPSVAADDIQRTRGEYVPPEPERANPLADRLDHRLAARIVEQARAHEASLASGLRNRSRP
jgi:hypothetical protein